MTKRTIDDIFQRLDDLWWNEWKEMDCLQSIFNFRLWPVAYWRNGVWNEWVEVTYWMPLYHPVVAMDEVDRTLETMLDPFFQGCVEFSNLCREITRIIKGGVK